MAYQLQKSKIGEVIFRQKLVNQHLGQRIYFKGEPDQKQIIKILKQRVASSQNIFKNLNSQNISLSPFLEIGAEKCQRAALLTSKFNAQGFALDISFESLKSAPNFAKKLNLKKLPILICADAENLPFADNSIPFVFAFETIHHFPKPHRVLAEMKRVSQKTIYFSEEPVKQFFNLGLWKRDYNLTLAEKILKKIYLLPFISRLGGSESSHNVTENEFSIGEWQDALRGYKNLQISLEPVFWGPNAQFDAKDNNWPINLLTKILIAIEGGGITVLAQIKKETRAIQKNNLLDLLICLVCKKSSLEKNSKRMHCLSCQSSYPIYNKVIIMLPPKLKGKLYPNF
ncbi:MAG: Methyltransferase type 11 [Candidatus Curtissbacteria bacterium GW2011_GWC2_38_9]|uniref:Methyltransferase type 11 domain-containing protein n=3 Tax=Candidatus Curtissiibacteriota TaxID=1752717 RepID=A0A1F5HUE6_9BACT|nr:MAG: Methyltransferase type 11 [Candidatus Curtissbacteria bacterium GW2011_GWC2_38_9]KKS04341.1 MAG: Methyltransferase type 11 [Candidatus Curtissbacteria bacterium GW2011_GWA2_41_24]OGD89087.1 MAG: hypothetical protein A2Z54_03255 [Candidatus Curtissbacteria bacterium RIFCSPHIGHO2_02_39_8]OGE07609.1 MAG: hypothetical protein A2W70_02350 [Candidatus Curtissbacteria bacterium RIFCSPLOWO2_02_41_11]